MKKLIRHTRVAVAAATVTLLFTACSAQHSPDGAAQARADLTRLQEDPQLASQAPIAIKDAETAVRAAEVVGQDNAEAQHSVFMANRKVALASALAKGRLSESQHGVLKEKRDDARLEARTREADELQRQINEMNAKQTERGLIVTLGDVLFDTARAELRAGAINHLTNLAAFLNQHQDRTVMIEGNTDSVGTQASNVDLSQRRADSVKNYLVGQGIAASRIDSVGVGEGAPIASNDSAEGRQQNRRVEVIISNPVQ
jgi:outer membrane protein OmpA-like peptidoglycan-associated protein